MTTRITTDNITDGTITGSDLGTIANSAINWQSVITADGSTSTTAVAGEGYFIDNSSATHTINLPASPSIGDTVKIILLGPGNSYNVTVGRNSSNIQGSASDRTMSQDNQSETFVYSNATEGWTIATSTVDPPSFISASGGTESTSGNYKIHSFTSSGCFVVSCVGNQSHTAEYLVVAGGGGGGGNTAGNGGGAGAGAGGFRTNYPSPDTGGFTLASSTYPITVGGGGPGGPGTSRGTSGSNSVFSTITSTGGGNGGSGGPCASNKPGANGGSGGGAGSDGGPSTGGSGNTPPVSPPQGNNGGDNSTGSRGAGGGGASCAGANATGPGGPVACSAGGDGTSNSITGTAVSYAGGGGGGAFSNNCNPGGAGGSGGGGTGAGSPGPGINGTAGSSNTGGGGGGGGMSPGSPGSGGSGGSGVVIIRYKYQ